MSTISTALRNFKEPTKEQLTQNFFSLPSVPPSSDVSKEEEIEKMDISAVLSLGVEGEEESYVSRVKHLSDCSTQYVYSFRLASYT